MSRLSELKVKCKVPRLKLDMEEWSKGKKKVSILQEEAAKVMESTDREGDDQALMVDLETLKTESRRMEIKRKEKFKSRSC